MKVWSGKIEILRERRWIKREGRLGREEEGCDVILFSDPFKVCEFRCVKIRLFEPSMKGLFSHNRAI